MCLEEKLYVLYVIKVIFELECDALIKLRSVLRVRVWNNGFVHMCTVWNDVTLEKYAFYFQTRVIFALFNRLWHDYYSEANEQLRRGISYQLLTVVTYRKIYKIYYMKIIYLMYFYSNYFFKVLK
jgi:hypothetical protein